MARRHAKRRAPTKKAKGDKSKNLESPEELERFAGSSEEESSESEKEEDEDEDEEKALVDDGAIEGDDDDDDESDAASSSEDEEGEKGGGGMEGSGGDPPPPRGDDDDDADRSSSSSSDDDDDERDAFSVHRTGMAGAMARILGPSSSSSRRTAEGKAGGTKPVVLSKTTTPLQRQLASQTIRESTDRSRRKANRELNLTCMHVPLSVATTLQLEEGTGGTGTEIAKELEMERMHRRVATRGVVALFNAIGRHRAMVRERSEAEKAAGAGAAGDAADGKTKKGADARAMNKHSFLELIKQGGGGGESASTEKDKPSSDTKGVVAKRKAKDAVDEEKKKEKGGGGGWNALKDDYMMTSKLKDWDKDLTSSSSDEYDDSDEDGVGRRGGGKEKAKEKSGTKRSTFGDDKKGIVTGGGNVKRRRVVVPPTQG